jgi:hypothetical protein
VLKGETEFRYGYKVVVMFWSLVQIEQVVSEVENCNLYFSFDWAGEREPEICTGDKWRDGGTFLSDAPLSCLIILHVSAMEQHCR